MFWKAYKEDGVYEEMQKDILMAYHHFTQPCKKKSHAKIREYSFIWKCKSFKPLSHFVLSIDILQGYAKLM